MMLWFGDTSSRVGLRVGVLAGFVAMALIPFGCGRESPGPSLDEGKAVERARETAAEVGLDVEGWRAVCALRGEVYEVTLSPTERDAGTSVVVQVAARGGNAQVISPAVASPTPRPTPGMPVNEAGAIAIARTRALALGYPVGQMTVECRRVGGIYQILFLPTAMQLGGDVTISVDAGTGAVVGVLRGQ